MALAIVMIIVFLDSELTPLNVVSRVQPTLN